MEIFGQERESANRQLRRHFNSQLEQNIQAEFDTSGPEVTIEQILIKATMNTLGENMFKDARVLEAYKSNDESTQRYSYRTKRALNTYLNSIGETPPMFAEDQ